MFDVWMKFNELIAMWASAFATAGAAVVALWIADKERRLRKRDRAFEGGMVRELIRPEIQIFLDRLVQAAISFQRIYAGRHIDDDSVLARLGGIGESLKLEVTRYERPGFAALTQEEADAAARLLGLLPMLRDLFTQFSLQAKDPFFVLMNRAEVKSLNDAAESAVILLGLPKTHHQLVNIGWLTDFPDQGWWSEGIGEAIFGPR